jgi:hypothetical protein
LLLYRLVRTPLAQGLFYLATGLWPIVHYRSFESVTGPKTDVWLVKTLGGLIAAVGAAMLVGAREGRSDATLRALGAGSALALGAADLVYASKGTISPVYLGDAVAEAAIVAGWHTERA